MDTTKYYVKHIVFEETKDKTVEIIKLYYDKN
jgi:hypothetical protein